MLILSYLRLRVPSKWPLSPSLSDQSPVCIPPSLQLPSSLSFTIQTMFHPVHTPSSPSFRSSLRPLLLHLARRTAPCPLPPTAPHSPHRSTVFRQCHRANHPLCMICALCPNSFLVIIAALNHALF
jgi:hypothetical protein